MGSRTPPDSQPPVSAPPTRYPPPGRAANGSRCTLRRRPRPTSPRAPGGTRTPTLMGLVGCSGEISLRTAETRRSQGSDWSLRRDEGCGAGRGGSRAPQRDGPARRLLAPSKRALALHRVRAPGTSSRRIRRHRREVDLSPSRLDLPIGYWKWVRDRWFIATSREGSRSRHRRGAGWSGPRAPP